MHTGGGSVRGTVIKFKEGLEPAALTVGQMGLGLKVGEWVMIGEKEKLSVGLEVYTPVFQSPHHRQHLTLVRGVRLFSGRQPSGREGHRADISVVVLLMQHGAEAGAAGVGLDCERPGGVGCQQHGWRG